MCAVCRVPCAVCRSGGDLKARLARRRQERRSRQAEAEALPPMASLEASLQGAVEGYRRYSSSLMGEALQEVVQEVQEVVQEVQEVPEVREVREVQEVQEEVEELNPDGDSPIIKLYFQAESTVHDKVQTPEAPEPR